MKIIFVNRYFYPDNSATSQLLTDLAFHLAERGKEVHIITSSQRYDDPLAGLPQQEIISGAVVHRVRTTRFGRRLLIGRGIDYASFYFSAAKKLLAIAARGDMIVAQTDPPLISVIAWLCARMRGARLMNWLHDIFPEVAQALEIKGIGGIAGHGLRKLRNLSLRDAAMNVVLGKLMAGYLVSQGVAKTRICIIPNWADGNDIRPLHWMRNPLRDTWGLGNGFIVGYSGNMGRAHEFETILAAAELLRNEPDINFLFIGDGHNKKNLQAAAAARGLTKIHFKPYQPRESLKFSLTLPDIHLVSLRPELEGLVVPSKFYSSIAAGRPVLFIGALEGEIPELLKKNDCGYIIRTHDACCLADSILKLYRNRDVSARMGENARLLFERDFEKRRALVDWEELLQL